MSDCLSVCHITTAMRGRRTAQRFDGPSARSARLDALLCGIVTLTNPQDTGIEISVRWDIEVTKCRRPTVYPTGVVK